MKIINNTLSWFKNVFSSKKKEKELSLEEIYKISDSIAKTIDLTQEKVEFVELLPYLSRVILRMLQLTHQEAEIELKEYPSLKNFMIFINYFPKKK